MEQIIKIAIVFNLLMLTTIICCIYHLIAIGDDIPFHLSFNIMLIGNAILFIRSIVLINKRKF